MNKAELIAKIAEDAGVTKTQANAAIDSFTSAVQKTLKAGEYNLKLFFYLLFAKTNAICAIDLDTIISCYFASVLKRKKRVYDAHEIFTEMKEVLENKPVHWFWTTVEKIFVPKYKLGYTVNTFIREEFCRRYKRNYEIVRNIPLKLNRPTNQQINPPTIPFIIYQGAVNEGRAFEQLIPAMQQVNCELRIYGKGNFFEQTKSLIRQHNVEDKVKLMGAFLPSELNNITPTALFGITIFDAEGMNQYYSLANRFFDYAMAGIPQICVDYPEYKVINNEYNIALLIDGVQSKTIATGINEMLINKELYNKLKTNCIAAREKLNWQNEENKLINYWNKIL
ncbi:unnamed protein product [Rotaria sp. Silwood1]|nr:unnamed protein product [Rotaria sp. Silwood1]CAF4961873.1 unnamed protein product [Rotaria sp. Silwood1]